MEPTFQSNDFVLIDKISSQKMKIQDWTNQSWGNQTAKFIGNTISSILPTITRGDIIVFVPPWKDIHYIKRVIGLPGETVTISENKVHICKTNTNDCFVLDESYLGSGMQTLAVCGINSFDIDNGLFVMGDNRDHSTDSRCCFTIWCYGDQSINKHFVVPYDYIIGKVWKRILPHYTSY